MKNRSIKSEDFNKYYKQLILKKIGIIGQKKILKSKKVAKINLYFWIVSGYFALKRLIYAWYKTEFNKM